MNILWIPHQPWAHLDGQREGHLIKRLLLDGHRVHVLTWDSFTGLGSLLKTVRSWEERDGDLTLHHFPRIANVYSRVTGRYSRGLPINEWLMRRRARHVIRRYPIDLMVYGPSHKLVGLPPFDAGVPRVFDYLDLCVKTDFSPDLAVERAYVRNSDLILCTTPVLVDRVRDLGGRACYLPNGVDRERSASGRRNATRRAHGVENSTVVSLIGPTWSNTGFFVDAIAVAARTVPNVVLLVVGGGRPKRLEALLNRCRRLGVTCVVVGTVPHSTVADYFAASDVGLYACDQKPFFDAACPLKVLEFSAAGKPVVATDLAGLRGLGLPNVWLAPPEPEAFGTAIARASAERRQTPDLREFDWTGLKDRFVAACQDVLATSGSAAKLTPSHLATIGVPSGATEHSK
jgi:glycosyltransferase involved in cell wall biosynthesis